MPHALPKRALPKCPICLQTGDQKFEINCHPIYECPACQHRYIGTNLSPTHVDEQYSDDYFTAGNAGYDNYLANRPLVEDHSRRYAAMIDGFHSQPGRCFAIGAAAGFDLVGFDERDWDVEGLEPNATMCRHAAEVLGFKLLHTSLESLDLQPQAPPFQLVLAIQVMAHFVDPRVAADKMSKLLSDDGLLLIETWNYRSITSRVWGKHWHEYSPPTVVQWFSPASLEKLMQQFQLTKVASGRPKKFIYGHHATSLLRYKLTSIPGMKLMTPLLSLIPDKMKIPYPSEDLFWMLFRRASS